MSIKWELVKAGDILWQKKRQKMGNTTVSCDILFRCLVTDIDHQNNTANVSWNNNPTRKWSRRDVEKLSRKKPTVRPNIFDRARIAMDGKIVGKA